MGINRYDGDARLDRITKALVDAGAAPPLELVHRAGDWLTFVDARGLRAMWSQGRPYLESAEGPALESDTVHIKGPFRGWADFRSRFVEEYPRRRVHPGGGLTCGGCGKDCDEWYTDVALWRRLPARWHRKILCVPCFVGMVPEEF